MRYLTDSLPKYATDNLILTRENRGRNTRQNENSYATDRVPIVLDVDNQKFKQDTCFSRSPSQTVNK